MSSATTATAAANRRRHPGASSSTSQPQVWPLRQALDTSGYVLATLQVAVRALRQPGILEDVLIEIANLGGNADTTAAAGGLPAPATTAPPSPIALSNFPSVGQVLLGRL